MNLVRDSTTALVLFLLFGHAAVAVQPANNKNAAATQIVAGTELFKDTVYSKSVIPNQHKEPFFHAAVEGGRNRLKIQADAALESTFLDTHYHFGLPEIIQLEELQNNTMGGSCWELVHYRYPWGPRKDGRQSDGMVRDVLMDCRQGLIAPVGVYALTQTDTNRFRPSPNHPENVVNTISYALFLQQTDGLQDFFIVGNGQVEVDVKTPGKAAEYPVVWEIVDTSKWNIRREMDFGAVQSVDTYISPTWETDKHLNKIANFEAQEGVQHLIIYYDQVVVIMTHHGMVQGCGSSSTASLQTFNYPEPSGVPKTSRVTHLEWSPLESSRQQQCGSALTIKNIVMTSSKNYNSKPPATAEYSAYSLKSTWSLDGWVQQQFSTFDVHAVYFDETFWSTKRFTVTDLVDSTCTYMENTPAFLDFSALKAVHSLYTVTDNAGGVHHVKLASTKDQIIAFILFQSTSVAPFELAGAFPLKLPDLDGLGEIVNFSGGTNKFGAMRFSVVDANGNFYVIRQREIPSDTEGYYKPIFGLFDDQGVPLKNPVGANVCPPPSCTSSNLSELWFWYEKTAMYVGDTSLKLLLSTVLAFGTSNDNLAQGLWLGSNYAAAHTPTRFGCDSAHIVVQETGSSDGQIHYGTFQEFNNPLTKTWHKRQISSQFTPNQVEEQITDEFYHVTLNLGNVDGLPVPYAANSSNADLHIEVRAESPITIQDCTNGFHHDIDRYTSFVAAPSHASAELSLTVKADSFANTLYVRLVNTTLLQSSTNDSAMLALPSNQPGFLWMTVNLAEQAQKRMSNSGVAVGSTRSSKGTNSNGSTAPPFSIEADNNVYVSPEALAKGNKEKPLPFKGSFKATNQTFTTLSRFVTNSAKTMTTFHSSYGASTALTNPLTDLTYFPSLPSTKSALPLHITSFDYKTGEMVTSESTFLVEEMGGVDSFGSFFGNIIHDVVHFIEHTAAFHELESAVVKVEHVADHFCSVSLSAGFMKLVTGVGQEFKAIVKTAEEFGRFVTNMVKTIGHLIDFIIALLSLFFHLEDILSLSRSLGSTFESLFSSKSGLEGSYKSSMFKEKGMKYLGKGNQVHSTISTVPSNKVPDELSTVISDVMKPIHAILNNPLVKKILRIFQECINAVNPFHFSFGESSSADSVRTAFDNAGLDLVENLVVDTEIVLDMLGGFVENMFQPKKELNQITQDLGSFAEGILDDVVEPLLGVLDDVVSSPPSYILDIMHEPNFLAIHIPLLADFLKLFGIGDKNALFGTGNTYSEPHLVISGNDALFLPMSIVLWVSHYTMNGNSASSFEQLAGTVAETELGGSHITYHPAWAMSNGALAALEFSTWSLSYEIQASPAPLLQGTVGLWAFTSLLRQTNNAIYYGYYAKYTPGGYLAWNVGKTFVRLMTPAMLLYCSGNWKCVKDSSNPNRMLNILLLINGIEALIDIVVAAVEVGLNPTLPNIVSGVGEMILDAKDFLPYAFPSGVNDLELLTLDLIPVIILGGVLLAAGEPPKGPPNPQPASSPTQAPTPVPTQNMPTTSTPTTAPTMVPTPNNTPTTSAPTAAQTSIPTPSNVPTSQRPTTQPTHTPSPSNRPTSTPQSPTVSPSQPSKPMCGCPATCTPEVLARNVSFAGQPENVQFTCGSYITYLVDNYKTTEETACNAVGWNHQACCPCTVLFDCQANCQIHHHQ